MKNKIVTVFGGGGFLGRSVIQRLAQQGARIRVAVRNTDTANHLRVYGDVGQIMPVQICLTDQKAVENVCTDAHSVINLTGRFFEKKTSTFEAIHIDAAVTIAKACSKQGVQNLVHISALGADKKASSKYLQTKAIGEQKVLKAFPNATILRPNLIFGAGDHFFSRFADMATVLPCLTLFNGGKSKFQPVYVGDVAEAITHSLQHKKTQGKTYELGGSQTYTFKSLMTLILKHTGRKKMLVSIPGFLAAIMAKILQFMPNPLITTDQLKILKNDTLVHKKAKTLNDLGITPAHLEAILPSYLVCYKPRF